LSSHETESHAGVDVVSTLDQSCPKAQPSTVTTTDKSRQWRVAQNFIDLENHVTESVSEDPKKPSLQDMNRVMSKKK